MKGARAVEGRLRRQARRPRAYLATAALSAALTLAALASLFGALPR